MINPAAIAAEMQRRHSFVRVMDVIPSPGRVIIHLGDDDGLNGIQCSFRPFHDDDAYAVSIFETLLRERGESYRTV